MDSRSIGLQPDGEAWADASTSPIRSRPGETAEPVNSLARRYLALDDYVQAAGRHLPRSLYGYVVGGAETDSSLGANRESFAEYSFVPRVLVDVSSRSSSTSLLGKTYAAPFGIAPMGGAALCAYRGDCVLAAAAASANIPMIVSAAALIGMEEIRREGSSTWCQLYLPGNPDDAAAMVDRVAAAGFETLVVTADVPIVGNRENDIRNGFSVPVRPSWKLLLDGATHPSWLFGTCFRTLARHGMPHMENMAVSRGTAIFSREIARVLEGRDRLSWSHLVQIRKRWKGTLVVKGVLAKEDARIAAESGADGIIVSNHGGRQLDGSVAGLRVLPEIVDHVRNISVMLDGGVRRGSDVLKALALGADFVFVGRPFLCAAAVGGERAVRHAISLLAGEVDRNMALLGLTSLNDITREFVRQ